MANYKCRVMLFIRCLSCVKNKRMAVKFIIYLSISLIDEYLICPNINGPSHPVCYDVKNCFAIEVSDRTPH